MTFFSRFNLSFNLRLHAVRQYAILAASADESGSRKERDDLVFLVS